MLAQHVVQCRIYVAVAAALAKGRGPGHGELAGRLALAAGQTEGAAYVVGREFARAGQLAAQTSFDRNRSTQQTADHLLHQRLSLFDDQQRTALRSHALYECRRQRILRDLQHGEGAAFREVLHNIVVGQTAGDDAHGFVRSVDVAVVARMFGLLLEEFVLLDEGFVTYARVARHEDPLAGPLGVVERVLLAGFADFDHGTRVGHAGRHAHQHRNLVFLREVERLADHLVGFLLRCGFEAGNHGEFGVEAGVLFVLRGVHRGIVRRYDHQAAVGTRHG